VGAERLRITAQAIADAAGGRLVAGNGDRAVDGFSIDTRTIAPGDLFIAIRGERFDGHAFVEAALAAGACGVVASRPEAIDVAVGKGAIAIEVRDTTRALQDVARHVRRASGARVVAITGSAGKTTTKEVTAALLAGRYRVFRNRGNLNNHIGLPLSLLELRTRPEVAVVELGMNHAGEIRTLVGIAEPEVRVWTNVSEVHAEFFASVDAIADAKAEIFEGASADSVLVANADDARVMARVPRFAGRLVTFGIEARADVSAREVRDLGLDGTEAVVETAAGRAALRSPLLGRANLANVLAAIGVGLQFGVPLDELVLRARDLEPAAHRGDVLRLPGGVTVIDDSYNSNPAALRRALEVLRQESRAARRIAVLGEMLELGDRSRALHEECGAAAAGAGLSRLVTIGGAAADAMARAAVRAGMAPDAVAHFPDVASALPSILAQVRSGDLVLVKGSRGIRTDTVVARLQAEVA
jgi:UDP-N-acetylmuramoyl-tripeptide--D-alanyl-D-alanine ligase